MYCFGRTGRSSGTGWTWRISTTADCGREEENRIVVEALDTLENAIGPAPQGLAFPCQDAVLVDPGFGAAARDRILLRLGQRRPALRHEGRRRSARLHAEFARHRRFLDPIRNHQTELDFTTQLIDQFDFLYDEANRSGGRIMSISLRPWVIGQPYRIGALEEALNHILSHAGVWSATGSEIMDAWLSQQAGSTNDGAAGTGATA